MATFQLFDDSLKRKHTSFFNIKTPRITKTSIVDQNEELIGFFKILIKKLQKDDPKLVWYPWREDNPTKPITKSTAFPDTREFLSEFVDKSFVEKGKENWSRIRLGHEIRIEHFCTDKAWFRKNGFYFKPDDLQVRSSVAAGWLLGSHPSMISKDLADAIQQHPSMQDIPIAIRFQAIRESMYGKIAKKDQVRAAHILSEYKHTAKCKSALKKIYADQAGEMGFPLGIPMRVIPNIADSRYKGNATTRKNCMRLKNKQKNFLKNTSTQPSHLVQNIDYHVKDIGSLRNIIMSMEAKNAATEKKSKLFVSIEESMEQTFVTYIYRNEHEEQALSTIQAMPLILEAHYGPRSGNWISPGHHAEVDGWTYDISSGTIKTLEDDYTASVLQNWDGDSDKEEETTPEFNVIIGEHTTDNEHFDANSVMTSASNYSSSSNEEPDFDRTLKKMTRLMSTVTPEQKAKFQELLNEKSSESDTDGGPDD